MHTKEIQTRVLNGWVILAVEIFALPLLLTLAYLIGNGAGTVAGAVVALAVGLITWGFVWAGFFTLQPNMAAVLLLFGKYRGTVKESGFCWANPLLKKVKISLRARNLNGQTIKVNDKRGNPIEIAAVVVWHVSDTAKAAFDVDEFEEYVTVQSEAALRHLASAYSYDSFDDDDKSLRGNMDDVSQALREELEERVGKAGVLIEEARLSHLAYAPEIASAMLQRQQADAIVAARTRIVDGAIGMVEMALRRLDEDGAINLDEERKASMVSNLLVVLCGDKGAQPVVNTGSLYT